MLFQWLTDHLHIAGFQTLAGADPYVDPHLEHDAILPEGVRIARGTLDQIAPPWDLVMFHLPFERVMGTARRFPADIYPFPQKLGKDGCRWAGCRPDEHFSTSELAAFDLPAAAFY